MVIVLWLNWICEDLTVCNATIEDNQFCAVSKFTFLLIVVFAYKSLPYDFSLLNQIIVFNISFQGLLETLLNFKNSNGFWMLLNGSNSRSKSKRITLTTFLVLISEQIVDLQYRMLSPPRQILIDSLLDTKVNSSSKPNLSFYASDELPLARVITNHFRITMSLEISYHSRLRNDTIEIILFDHFESMKPGCLNWENVSIAIQFCWKD